MKEISQHIKAVIFDMDGTIIHSNNNWLDVISETIRFFRPSDCPIFNNRLAKMQKKLLGVDIITCAKILKKEFDLHDILEKDILDKIISFENNFIQDIKLIPGFLDFHKELKTHGIKSCIATNSLKPYLNRMSDIFNFNQLFEEHIYCVNDVNLIPKPQPDLFLHSAKKLQVLPSECIVFEDTRTGFLAAQNAKMKCIAIINENNIFSHNLVHGKIENYHSAINELRNVLKL